MKILLTGAQGQVGRELVELAKKSEHDLLAFSKADLDITQFEQIEEAVSRLRPKLIINAAAYTAVDKAEEEAEQAFLINRDAVGNLAKVCKHYDLPLIHLSTDYVFDGSKALAYVESDLLAPLNVYGESKAQGELILQNEWEKHLIVRTSWVFGRYGSNFVKTILRLALKQKELRIVSDQAGCPTAASDLAAALLKLATQVGQGSSYWGVYHYCGEAPTNWFKFAHLILDYAKDYLPLQVEQLIPIMSTEFPRPAKRPKNSVLCMDKIVREYGLEPSVWEQALKQVIQNIIEQGELRETIST